MQYTELRILSEYLSDFVYILLKYCFLMKTFIVQLMH